MLDIIRKYKIVPVVVLKKIENTIPTLSALCDGGLPIAEITFRTDCAEEAIKLGVKQFPDMLIGSGTVINAEQTDRAIASGAKFIVSPGLSKSVAEVCKKANIPYIPGIITPTEVIQALEIGLTTLKFFPSENFGGLKTLKALSAAFPQVSFMPTGGIDESNIAGYLAFDKVIAVGGSFMFSGGVDGICEKVKNILYSIYGD